MKYIALGICIGIPLIIVLLALYFRGPLKELWDTLDKDDPYEP